MWDRFVAGLLEVRDVTKTLGGRQVLREVSLSIDRGANLTITGRSGSGKSTLLKLLAGLDAPTTGKVLLDGVDLAGLEDEALSAIRLRKIGLLFQSPMLLPDMTVRENVLLPLQLAEVPRPEAESRVRDLLSIVGVLPFADKRPNALSGGEAQRVSIARSLANQPSILLADEPTTGLDRANAENVLDLLTRANRDLGTTVIVATHDPLAIAAARQRLELEEGLARWVEPSGQRVETTSRR